MSLIDEYLGQVGAEDALCEALSGPGAAVRLSPFLADGGDVHVALNWKVDGAQAAIGLIVFRRGEPGIMHFASLLVQPEYQRRGIYETVLEGLGASWCPRYGINEVRAPAMTSASEALFLRSGFEPFDGPTVGGGRAVRIFPCRENRTMHNYITDALRRGRSR